MKYIEASDLHFDPNWSDVFSVIVDSIAKAARDNDVDFIAFPGDLYNRPIYATDKGGVNELRQHIKRLSDICPVVAVYGTPSHEAPGSLDLLEDSGLTVLRPGKVYGFYDALNKSSAWIQDISDMQYHSHLTAPNAVIFGIPELNKHGIQSQLSLPADEANAEAINLFRQYVSDFIAPMRMKYSSIPAVALLHGNVSDAKHENETDRILKASDIVIHTEDLRVANIDRWSLGHIHHPWESEVVHAGYPGYGGIDGNPWTNLGFVPAMNIVDISQRYNLIDDSGRTWEEYLEEQFPEYDDPSDIDAHTYNLYRTDWELGTHKENIHFATIHNRIPYGTPERRKIKRVSQAVDLGVAYWLHTDDPNAELPEHVHAWSRITYDEKKTETRRVTSEQAEAAKTLRDLFKLIDPDVTNHVLDLVDTISANVRTQRTEPIDVRMESVKVEGCTFFKGRTYRLEASQLLPGLNGIRGNNGAGKSSSLAFWTPYPFVVGKDTSSGRISAIKEFFDQPTSIIRKRLTVNGVPHEHTITIRGAHTKSAKTECSLSIDGQPQLDKGTFDEMMSECERLYGPSIDYMLTTFYVQPLQGKSGSSLMSATMTDIRDLVQSIAGIDRESEKRYALDRVKENETRIESLRNWLAGAREFQADIPALENELVTLSEELETAQKRERELLASGEAKRSEYDTAVKQQNESEAEEKRRQSDSSRQFQLAGEISSKRELISKLRVDAELLESNRSKLASDEVARTANQKAEAIELSNQRKKSEYDTAVSDALRAIRQRNEDDDRKYKAELRESEDDIARLKSDIAQRESQLSTMLEPCEKCGHVKADIQKRYDELRIVTDEKIRDLKTSELNLESMTAPIPEPEVHGIPEPEYDEVPEKSAVLTESERNDIKAAIDRGIAAEASITAAEERIEQLEAEDTEISERTYAIIEGISDTVTQLGTELKTLQDDYRTQRDKVTEINTKISNTSETISKARDTNEKIEKSESELQDIESKLESWKYIAVMLQPSKIPAMELDIVLDSIDAEATRIIEPLDASRYSFSTITQSEGKSGTVDKFDILIHDAETAVEKSFLKHSPGEKAFFSDAYVKALVRKRDERSRRRYDPVIMDESDGPIQPERIPAYYQMQTNYWTDRRVCVVSHSPTSHEYIENTINMEDLLS